MNPDFALAWFGLGQVELKQGHYDAAREAYERAVVIDRKSSPPSTLDPRLKGRVFPVAAYGSLGLAQVALRQAEADRARQILEHLTEAHPKFGPAQRLLARIYREMNRPRAAERRLAMAHSCNAYVPPADPMVDELVKQSCSTTFLLKQQGVADRARNHPRAEYIARRAVMVDGEDTDAIAALGLALLSLGRADEGLSYLEKYRRMAPGDGSMLGKMGMPLFDAGLKAKGIEYLEAALLIGPNKSSLHSDLGICLSRLRQYSRAIEHYRKALEIDPTNVKAHDNWGLSLAYLGRFEQAIEHYEKALEINPQHVSGHKKCGFALARLGKFGRAVQHYRRAVDISPNDRDAVTNLAWLLATCPDDAVRDGPTAVVLAEGLCQATRYREPILMDILAAAYAEAGRFPQAIATATAALKRTGPGQKVLAQSIRLRLEGYRAGKPYRFAAGGR